MVLEVPLADPERLAVRPGQPLNTSCRLVARRNRVALAGRGARLVPPVEEPRTLCRLEAGAAAGTMAQRHSLEGRAAFRSPLRSAFLHLPTRAHLAVELAALV
jgi:hypothetical protein